MSTSGRRGGGVSSVPNRNRVGGEAVPCVGGLPGTLGGGKRLAETLHLMLQGVQAHGSTVEEDEEEKRTGRCIVTELGWGGHGPLAVDGLAGAVITACVNSASLKKAAFQMLCHCQLQLVVAPFSALVKGLGKIFGFVNGQRPDTKPKLYKNS